jgi:hypothetical protein
MQLARIEREQQEPCSAQNYCKVTFVSPLSDYRRATLTYSTLVGSRKAMLRSKVVKSSQVLLL